MAESTSLRQLPLSTVRLITSSQVITSVFSVVKELLENALDAGATTVEVKLENYGFQRVEVRDNGKGVAAADVPFMARPHFTSKLNDFDDLAHITTYGFRGEALGSLCAVADLSITTKTCEQTVGMSFSFDKNGHPFDEKPSQINQGTTITVSQLFATVPVRRQYFSSLSKKKEELRRVEELVLTYGMVHPSIRFILRHECDVIWQKPPVKDVRAALVCAIGANLTSNLQNIKKTCPDTKVQLDAYLPSPTADFQVMSRPRRDRCFIFINKRPVQHKGIEKVLRDVYCDEKRGRWPVAYIQLITSPEMVDCNLEPNKTRVALRLTEEVLSFFKAVLVEVYGEALSNKNTKLIENSNLKDKEEKQHDVKITEKNDLIDSLTQKVDDQNNIQTNFQASKKQCVTENVEKDPVMSITDNPDLLVVNKTEDITTDMPCDTSTINNSETADVSTVFSSSEATFNLQFSQQIDSTQFKRSEESNTNASTFWSLTSTANGAAAYQPNLLADIDFDSDLSDIIPAPDVMTPTHTHTETRSHCGHFTDKDDLFDVQNDDNHRPDNSVTHSNLIESDKENERDGQKDCETISGASAGSWSRGTALFQVAGSNPQPVKLLSSNSGAGDSCSIKAGHAQNNSTNSGDSSERNSLISQSLPSTQPTLYDVVGGIPTDESSTAYIAFSREVRPSVIADNPKASFEEVAKIITKKWRLQSLEDIAKYKQQAEAIHVHPLQVGNCDSNSLLVVDEDDNGKFRMGRCEKKVNRSLSSESSATRTPQSSRKRRRLSEITPQFKKKPEVNVIKTSTDNFSDRRIVNVNFNMTKMRNNFLSGLAFSQSLPDTENTFSPIGQIKSQSLWLGVQDSDVMMLQPIRAQEELTYQELLANHILPCHPVQKQTFITKETVSPELWEVLLKLLTSDANDADGDVHHCTDPRISSNGFEIFKYIDNTGDITVEIGKICQSINFYGMSDLKQILEKIRDCTFISLTQCRPPTVRHYLQAEAVRISRLLPSSITAREASDIVSRTRTQLLPGQLCCFHNKPFLKSLHHIDLSAADQSTISQNTSTSQLCIS